MPRAAEPALDRCIAELFYAPMIGTFNMRPVDRSPPPSYDELQVKEVCRRFVFPGWYRIQLSPLHEYRRGILACTTSYPVAA